MPTIDELASQVAALEQQMAAITTPPDKYYTSIYSGEEIDAAITKVRSGAMGVSSFNGRAGAVMPQAGDYNATQIPVSADTGAETVAAALANKPNRNLLDNWYFGNPINQRGQTSYNTPGYSIDRWYLQGGSFELSDNALTFLFPPASGGAERFNQKIPLEKFIHGVYTISILTTDGLYSKSFEYEPGDNADVQFNMGNGVYIGFYTQDGSLPSYRFFNAGTSENISVSIIATKLEVGDHQTLAHQDEDGNWVLNEIPDYGEELAKCQRYLIPMDANSCWGFAESNTSAYLYLPLPVSMRTTPVFQGNLPPTLWPGGNSVTSISVFSTSAIESMIALHVVGTGFIAQNCYSLNQPIGFLSAEL